MRFWSPDKETIDSLLVLLRLHSISSFLYTEFSLFYALKEIVDHTCFQKEKPRIPNEPRKDNSTTYKGSVDFGPDHIY